MLDSSSFRYLLATEAEIQALFAAHGMDIDITTWIISSENFVDQGEIHNGLCCKLWTTEYTEPTTGSPIATIDRQTFVSGKTALQIRRLRVGMNVYCLKLPENP